ncbi:hypothetical protein FRB96_002662 [Tulasnella sp. 330]|nr:hypothetical protein FRB96_002662 [Tulasnella sp. 330]
MTPTKDSSAKPSKAAVLIPLSEEIDPKYGPKSEALTVGNGLVLALTNFWIYCNLFHHSISETYLPSTVEALSAATRRDWLRFCIPDANCNKDFPDEYE